MIIIKHFLYCLLLIFNACSVYGKSTSYSFDTFPIGTLLDSQEINNSDEGVWTVHDYVNGVLYATIETAPWGSPAISLSTDGIYRGIVGTMTHIYDRTKNISMSVRCGQGDRHAPFLCWDGNAHSIVELSPHPVEGYVFQYRSSTNYARITLWANNTYYPLKEVQWTVADESDFILECGADADGRLWLELDGLFVMEVYDSTYMSGGMGLMNWGATPTFFDSIQVREGTNVIEPRFFGIGNNNRIIKHKSK